MQPFYLKIDKLPLMVIPESYGHMDGHPVLTYSYAIFRDEQPGDHQFVDIDKLLSPEKKADPRYMGVLTFEQPGKVFTYEADGHQELSGEEVQDVIAEITHYRENPTLWRL